MIRSNPGMYSWYPSYMCSPWYVWFVELGYPNLDIVQHRETFELPDGSYLTTESGVWSIIEYYNAPIIPSLTRWNYVLANVNDQEISKSFIEKMVGMLDLRRKQVWDMAEAKTKAMEDEKEKLEAHAQDTAERAKNLIMRCPTTLERVAKDGIAAANPTTILKHIPRHQKNGLKGVELL